MRRPRARALAAGLAAACVAATATAAPSATAASAAPPGFFGVTFEREAAGLPPALQAGEWSAMRASGVQSVRVLFRWELAQPAPGGPVDFTATDPLVIEAADHGLRLLPIVMYAPTWARTDPGSAASPPRRAADYVAYLRALVGRYGPRGTLWGEYPQLARRPVREWQVWNEPAARFQWDAPGWQRGYGALLSAAHAGLRRADPGAKTVMAGLANFAWRDLDSLLRARPAVARAFDVAALHLYTASARDTPRAVGLMRRVLRRRGARRAALWVTEMGLPASRGRVSSSNSLQTTDAGMAAFLRGAYSRLIAARVRPSQRADRVYWYTWASGYRGDDIFDYSGLRGFADGITVDEPALAAYRTVARRRGG